MIDNESQLILYNKKSYRSILISRFMLNFLKELSLKHQCVIVKMSKNKIESMDFLGLDIIDLFEEIKDKFTN